MGSIDPRPPLRTADLLAARHVANFDTGLVVQIQISRTEPEPRLAITMCFPLSRLLSLRLSEIPQLEWIPVVIENRLKFVSRIIEVDFYQATCLLFPGIFTIYIFLILTD